MIPLVLLAAAVLVVPSCPAGRSRLRRLHPPIPPARSDSARPSAGWLLPTVSGAAVGLLSGTVVGGLPGVALAVVLGVGVAGGARALLARGTGAVAPAPLQLAGGWDLLAACLRAGLPVPVAVHAVAEHLPDSVARELRTIAERLVLGADPRTAWEVAETSPLHKLARAAHRSAHSGAGLAAVASSAAAEVRTAARDVAAARGQRAGVLITGPLGLCFLPAFLALGVVPVVIGLATGLAQRW